MVNISIGTALLAAVLGYFVVFLGIILLMSVIYAESAVNGTPKKKNEISEKVIDLGTISVPKNTDLKKIAVIAAVTAYEEGDR